MKLTPKEINTFIIESNRIEDEHSIVAHNDATKAFSYALGQQMLTIKEVKHVHYLLMRRLNPRIAGKFRDCAIYIGGRRIDKVDEVLLQNVLDDMNELPNMSDEATEAFTKRMHVLFESVHPFEDGNGRVGRILYNWHRIKLGLPLHVIHADGRTLGVLGDQHKYYQWFRDLS